MRLSRKLTLALSLGVLVVMAAYALAQIRQEVWLSQADLTRARRIGLAWLGVIEAVWQREGPSRVLELIEDANQRTDGLNIRLIERQVDPDFAGLGLTPEQRAELDAGRMTVADRVDGAGEDWRYVYAPLTVGGSHPAVVEVVESFEPEQSFIQMSHAGIAAATVAIVLVCALIASAIQYRLVGRPIELLRDKARRVGGGDFSRPLQLSQRDEIGELAADLNAMSEQIASTQQKLAEESEARVAALEQLRHVERLSTVGRLAAGVAHELGTPLNVVAARAEMLAGREMAPAEVAKNARIIAEQAERMTGIIQQLLDFSRRRSATPAPTVLAQLVARSLDLLSSVAKRAEVRLRFAPPADPGLALVDRNQILQVLTNVVLNAIQATPAGGEVSVSLSARETSPHGNGDVVCVRVEDCGAGIPAERLPHIFEPFFTTKAVGEGTGLGLAVAHGIVAEHGGWIDVVSEAGQGSCFSIYLPAAASGEAAVA